MQPYFTTSGIHPGNAFRQWREMVNDRMAPAEIQNLADAPFQVSLEAAQIGALRVTRSFHSPLRTEATADTVRRSGQQDQLIVLLNLEGRSAVQQDDREAVCGAGDLVVLGARPAVHVSGSISSLVLNLPREPLERMLGPARLFTVLTAKADLASTVLATTYLKELIRVGGQLAPDSATRMAAIGTDLIVASLAERMAQEVPRTIHGNVTVQRAKAYVEANLSDPDLDPPHLAAATGVSLRRLQELFHERGQHVSDWIWHRRMEAAAKRLGDPACAHLSIGMLAYGSGFSSQAHFARRFRDRYGMTPREYRRAALLGPSAP